MQALFETAKSSLQLFTVPEGFSSETKNSMWSSLTKLARRWKLNVGVPLLSAQKLVLAGDHLQLPPITNSEISNSKLHESEPNQKLKLETDERYGRMSYIQERTPVGVSATA